MCQISKPQHVNGEICQTHYTHLIATLRKRGTKKFLGLKSMSARDQVTWIYIDKLRSQLNNSEITWINPSWLNDKHFANYERKVHSVLGNIVYLWEYDSLKPSNSQAQTFRENIKRFLIEFIPKEEVLKGKQND